jgi:hypothetical protein
MQSALPDRPLPVAEHFVGERSQAARVLGGSEKKHSGNRIFTASPILLYPERAVAMCSITFSATFVNAISVEDR